MTDSDPSAVIASLRRDGYALVGPLHDPWQVASWRALGVRLTPGMPAMGQFPRELAPCFAHPQITAIVRAVLGTHALLNEVVLRPFPSRNATRDCGRDAFDWHRDRFGYEVRPTRDADPSALTFITYLQDLNEITGPLRVVPRSHRDPERLQPRPPPAPHWGERCLTGCAGQVWVLDNRLLHSGSPNWSGQVRFYLAATFARPDRPRADVMYWPIVRSFAQRLRQSGCDDLAALVDGWSGDGGVRVAADWPKPTAGETSRCR